MSKTTGWIIGVIIVVGILIFGYFWMKGKQMEAEMKQKAEALRTRPPVEAPAPAAPTEPTAPTEKKEPVLPGG